MWHLSAKPQHNMTVKLVSAESSARFDGTLWSQPSLHVRF
jgi:hypothetical protein